MERAEACRAGYRASGSDPHAQRWRALLLQGHAAAQRPPARQAARLPVDRRLRGRPAQQGTGRPALRGSAQAAERGHSRLAEDPRASRAASREAALPATPGHRGHAARPRAPAPVAGRAARGQPERRPVLGRKPRHRSGRHSDTQQARHGRARDRPGRPGDRPHYPVGTAGKPRQRPPFCP